MKIAFQHDPADREEAEHRTVSCRRHAELRRHLEDQDRHERGAQQAPQGRDPRSYVEDPEQHQQHYDGRSEATSADGRMAPKRGVVLGPGHAPE
jgi:hypothetical protein